MIRYYCHTDAFGPRADLCARYAEAFVAMGLTVRVLSVEQLNANAVPPGQVHRWKHLQALFTTPVSTPFVNVVCADPFWWSRLYTVGVKNVLITGAAPEEALEVAKIVPPSARMAAGTKTETFQGITHEFEIFEVPREPLDPVRVATRFQTLIVPNEAIARAWQDVIDETVTHVDHGEEAGQDVCQVVVVGLDLAERAQTLRRVLDLG